MVFECRYLHFQKNAVSWYVSFYIHIRFVPKFSNASFCGLYTSDYDSPNGSPTREIAMILLVRILCIVLVGWNKLVVKV